MGTLKLKSIVHMKTTILGILIIVSAVSNACVQLLKGGSPDLIGAFTTITAGIGLIKAQDQ